ncbi:MAG: Regulatory protein RecX [Chlamydiia bacterium]|nr:Regulatory protein RecX [Chlamydiia bacterium]MCH9616701.1 Regulatory protein RecX [Chlamydiia bacterium]MCH9629432.1 Regulatory protein RecX [Chlamydiia bacterium]
MSATKIAYNLLALRGYFSDELEAKLLSKGCEKEEIDAIIVDLKRLGYLDDERELNLFIARQLRKGNGPYLIKAKLRERTNYGFVDIGQEDQRPIIEDWIKKKSSDSKEKLYRFLSRKGFDTELVRGILLD